MTTPNRIGSVPLVSVLLAIAFVTCLAPAMAQGLTFTLRDDVIIGPDTTDLNGFVLVTFVNESDLPRDMTLDHIRDGVAYETFIQKAEAVFAAGEDSDFTALIADWITAADAIGGTSVPARGQAVAYLRLEPGEYVVEAVVNEEGTEPADFPFVHGRFTVVPGTVQAPPATDLTVHMLDFHYDFPEAIAAGPQLWEVVAAGSQPHIGVFFRLREDTSLDDFQAWLASAGPESGPPPAEPAGALLALTAGQTMIVPVDLAPGAYAVVCFLPDLASGAPHFVLGMIDGFTVR